MFRSGRPTILMLTQVFPPDPASLGQHLADVATEMTRRGYDVRLFAANRGYEDPTLLYPARELMHGVNIRRLPFSSFGKTSLFRRGLGTASLMLQFAFITLFYPNVRGIFFSTSPPMIGLVAAVARLVRRIPIAYWAMDLNPDQLIAMKRFGPLDARTRFLEDINRFILRESILIIALDRFMVERLLRRGPYRDKIIVLPPWSHEDHIECPKSAERSDNPFRQRHALGDRFVVMYSGNHSPSNPLTTLLAATLAFSEDDSIRFVFVGGGVGKKEVENFKRTHPEAKIVTLPYQPLAELGNSLSAGDLHVVSLGEEMVGIIHPCKIYGAMAVARPVLYFGPCPSHVSDILLNHPIGWSVPHGDVVAAVAAIRTAQALRPAELKSMGLLAHEVLHRKYAQSLICGKVCDALEHTFFANQPMQSHRDVISQGGAVNHRTLVGLTILLAGLLLSMSGCNKHVREVRVTPETADIIAMFPPAVLLPTTA